MPANAEPKANRPLSKGLVLLMAVTCGAAVANIYYAQPLLSTIGHDFGVSDGTAGLIVTASQVGYAAGLVLLVPLGDLLERRRLITRIMLVTVLALAATAASPSLALLAAALVIVGLTSVVAQIVVPMASTLAAEHERGRVVGNVMSGLLVGILIARTASGLIAQAGGWRLVFAVSAALMLVLCAVLRARLPEVHPTAEMSYRELLRSVGRLVIEQPTLRVRMVYGALGMGQFSVLWTTIAFLLSGAPYRYGDATIGLFGLVGLAGALAAQAAGRLADRGRHHRSTGSFFVVMLISWLLIGAGSTSLGALIAGIAILDLGVQGAQITNQSVVYGLDPAARSRLTTAYMTALFASAAIFSALSSTLYDAAGWSAIATLGGALAGLGVLVWLAEQTLRRRRGAGAGAEMGAASQP
ncbi:MAG TPA: MFS transporter [Solirubrobacteraceae bacterium]|jgi:predicted MFS family arabinose efflux permease|nr:MFS transporter [Solirubrobacteraceae bacterium]